MTLRQGLMSSMPVVRRNSESQFKKYESMERSNQNDSKIHAKVEYLGQERVNLKDNIVFILLSTAYARN